MKRIITILLFCNVCMVGFAQDTSKFANIRTFLQLTGSGKLGIQVMENMFGTYKKSFPEVPQEFWNGLLKEMNADALINMVIPIYDKYFTSEEIGRLIEFYQTPIGQKVVSTMPVIMQESMQVGEAWGKEIGEKVYNNLKAKGFIK